MRLCPMKWFFVSTATKFQSAQPSTSHTTPRLENGGTPRSVHQSVRLQLHSGQQPQRKSTLRLGQQAFGHLSHHVEEH